MHRHPAGVLILLFLMLVAATIADSLLHGSWAMEHWRGVSVMPAIGVALLVLHVAGRSRGLVAVLAEASAIMCVLLALNHLRLVHKWHPHGWVIEQGISIFQAIGFLMGAFLLVRSRPPAQEGDWHRGSAILGAALWIVGRRSGPGSRAGLGLAAVVLSSALIVGMFEKVKRAPAMTSRIVDRLTDALPDGEAGDESAPSTRRPSTVPTWTTGRSDATAAGSADAAHPDDRTPRPAGEPDEEAAGTTGTTGTTGTQGTTPPRWFTPAAERQLPTAAPRIRPPAERVRTRIHPDAPSRMGPWAGVLTDRTLLRGGRPHRDTAIPMAASPRGTTRAAAPRPDTRWGPPSRTAFPEPVAIQLPAGTIVDHGASSGALDPVVIGPPSGPGSDAAIPSDEGGTAFTRTEDASAEGDTTADVVADAADQPVLPRSPAAEPTTPSSVEPAVLPTASPPASPTHHAPAILETTSGAGGADDAAASASPEPPATAPSATMADASASPTAATAMTSASRRPGPAPPTTSWSGKSSAAGTPRSPAAGPVTWSDPRYVFAEDIGAMSIASPSPWLRTGVVTGVVLVTLVLVVAGGRTAGRGSASRPVTGTTGTP